MLGKTKKIYKLEGIPLHQRNNYQSKTYKK